MGRGTDQRWVPGSAGGLPGPVPPEPGGLALRPVRPAGWWLDGLLLVAFAVLTLTLAAGGLLRVDLAVRNWSDGHRPRVPDVAAEIGNRLGQGTWLAVICLLIAVWLGWRRHSVRPVLPVLAAELLTYAVLGPLKLYTARPAPHANVLPPYVSHPERLFSSAGGLSYPSGHLANAIVWYGVLALLLAPWLNPTWRRVVRVVPPAVLVVTTVYLGYHWLTDTVAGVMLGLVLGRLLYRVPWDDLPLGRRLDARGWAGRGLPTTSNRDATMPGVRARDAVAPAAPDRDVSPPGARARDVTPPGARGRDAVAPPAPDRDVTPR